MEKEKIALITGASGEIGSSIAKILGKEGYQLVLHYHTNDQALSKLENNLKIFNIKVKKVKADLTNHDEINQLFNDLGESNFFPNILVNNAGISSYGLIQDVSINEFHHLINANIMSAYFCSQKVVPEMIKNGYGRIINISSIWGEIGAANEVLYSLTKGAINTFTKALARELAPSGITVNAIAPGVVMSKMMAEFDQEELDELKNDIPMRRFLKGEEIGQMVLHLLHPNSSYMTGQILTIDGGWS